MFQNVWFIIMDFLNFLLIFSYFLKARPNRPLFCAAFEMFRCK
jgi:hypothetical protein